MLFPLKPIGWTILILAAVITLPIAMLLTPFLLKSYYISDLIYNACTYHGGLYKLQQSGDWEHVKKLKCEGSRLGFRCNLPYLPDYAAVRGSNVYDYHPPLNLSLHMPITYTQHFDTVRGDKYRIVNYRAVVVIVPFIWQYNQSCRGYHEF